jgi:hypothetical protein
MKRALALLITLGAVGFLVGCSTPPPGEVRTFMEDPNATPALTDASHRWNMTSLRQAYSCPLCGWSASAGVVGGLPVRCPDYYGVHGLQTISLLPTFRRVLDTVEMTGANAADQCDYHYQDAAGVDRYFAVMGRPYHPNNVRFIPTSTPPTPGSTPPARQSRVFVETRGLRDTTGGTALPGQSSGYDLMRARFLYIPPGVTEPRAYAYHDTLEGDQVGGAAGDAFADVSEVYGDPMAQRWIDPLNNGFSVAVNPHRVSSDDRYWVRYTVLRTSADPATNVWRLEIYSRMNGLEMDTGRMTDAIAANPFYLVTLSGSLRCAITQRQDPDPTNLTPASWVFSFRIASNCRIVPGGADGHRPAVIDPTTLAGFDTLSWPRPSWPMDGVHFDIADTGAPAYGRVTDTDDVHAGANNLNRRTRFPIVVQPGEVGVGRVEVQWSQRNTNLNNLTWSGTGASNNAFRYDPPNANGPLHEWWYDRTGEGSNYACASYNASAPNGAAYDAIVCRFMSTRANVRPTNETDRHGSVEPTRNAPANMGASAYPRILADDVIAGARDGAARPGSVTERRPFTVDNQGLQSGSPVLVDGACWAQGLAPGNVTEQTSEARNSTIDDITLWRGTPQVNDAYYFGGTSRFTGLILAFSRAAASLDMTTVWEYSTGGGGWSPLNTNLWEDHTIGLQSQLLGRRVLRFDPPGGWATDTIGTMQNLYWIRCRCTVYNASATLPLASQAWLIPSYGGMSRCPREGWAGVAGSEGCGAIFVDTQGGTLPYFPHPLTRTPGTALNSVVNSDSWCPYCLAAGRCVPVVPWSTTARLDKQMVQSMIVPEQGTTPAQQWSSTLPTLRPQLPDDAVQMGPVNTSLPQSSSRPFWVSIAVPKYQRSSEPGDAPGNNLANNWGYRGQAILYQTVSPRGYTGLDYPNDYNDNGQWDMFYTCPDCGTRQAVGDVPPNAWACANTTCPGHVFCNWCGTIWPAGTTNCLYCGGTVTAVPRTANNVNHNMLASEEYEPFDVQLSVLKLLELAAGRQSADLGRTAGGVNLKSPDGGAAIADNDPRAADPADVSHWGEFVIRNEGNTLPSLLGLNANTTADNALYRAMRPEALQGSRSYSWAGSRNPIALGLNRTFFPDMPGGAYNPLIPTSTVPWQPLVAQPSAPAGAATGGALRVGAGSTAENGGAAPTATDVIGNGQVLGRYNNLLIYYQDSNNNGVFDFYHPATAANSTTSAQEVFDPVRDEAIEPYVIAQSKMRVSESRLPFNDYADKDAAPTLWFRQNATGEPSGMQFLWMRTSGATPDAPSSLIYTSATAAGAGENRNYTWNGGVSALDLGTATLAQNGPADIYRDPAGGAYAVWHSTNRAGGGLRSVIRQSTFNAGSGTWGAPVNVTMNQERAEGVRGFFDPDYASGGQPLHWTFWHSGTRGNERAMFEAWYWGAGGKKTTVAGGPLPLDMAKQPSEPSGTVRTLWDIDSLGPIPAVGWNPDGTGPSTGFVDLQKFPQGPFSAVKDISPILYLPPTVYSANSGDPNGDVTQPQIRVFFAGYARHLGNYDIYEARFRRKDLLNGTNNWGKIAFLTQKYDERIRPSGLPATNPTEVEQGMPGSEPGEELTTDALRREFHSLDLDWVTGTDYVHANGGASFLIGVKLYGVPDNIQYYDVTWSGEPERGEYYDAKRGVYVVIPRLRRHDDQFMDLPSWPFGPAAPAGGLGSCRYIPAGASSSGQNEYELIEPTTAALPSDQKRPLRMEIDPVLGRIRFSAPLFNSQNPSDRSCVFNTGFSQLANKIEDVFVCANYSAFLRRITTSQADDDCPTAIMQSGPWNGNVTAPATQARPWGPQSNNNTLQLFWRRTFGTGQAPYYGRSCYMMKQFSWTFRVDHPPMTGPKTSVIVKCGGANYAAGAYRRGPFPQTDPNGSQLVGPGMPTETLSWPVVNQTRDDYPSLAPGWNEYDVDMTNGTVSLWPGAFRWWEYAHGEHVMDYFEPGTTFLVTYTDLNGTVHTDEAHTIGGWSQETIVPIDTVISEGPLRVAEETYTVPARAVPQANDPAPVSWRYWISWTSPRPVYDLRTYLPQQSSDIYYCAVQPEFPALVRESIASTFARNAFRP